ncbi:unnamed protein product, partial [Discosporangium mesarthrocarpum]
GRYRGYGHDLPWRWLRYLAPGYRHLPLCEGNLRYRGLLGHLPHLLRHPCGSPLLVRAHLRAPLREVLRALLFSCTLFSWPPPSPSTCSSSCTRALRDSTLTRLL